MTGCIGRYLRLFSDMGSIFSIKKEEKQSTGGHKDWGEGADTCGREERGVTQ